MKPEITEVPTAQQVRAMADRLLTPSFRGRMNREGQAHLYAMAALTEEAAAMLTALADDMEQWVEPPRITLGKV